MTEPTHFSCNCGASFPSRAALARHHERNHPPASEAVRVEKWRRDRLIELGLDEVLAEAFAKDTDPHDVEALVKKGCPPDVALEIVR